MHHRLSAPLCKCSTVTPHLLVVHLNLGGSIFLSSLSLHLSEDELTFEYFAGTFKFVGRSSRTRFLAFCFKDRVKTSSSL